MMPRLSLYVQDDLWDRARATKPRLNPSQVVQAALRRFVATETDRPRFAEPPAVEPEELEGAANRLAAEARERYEHGFKEGLEFGGKLRWRHFDHLAGCNWDVRQWLTECEERHSYFGGDDRTPLFAVLDIGESLADYIARDLLPRLDRETAFRRGFVEGLQKLWNAVMQSQPPASDAGDADADSGGAMKE